MLHLRKDLSQIVLLVRHGAAVPRGERPERPLSATGRVRAGRMAAWLASHRVTVDRIEHSDRARARQTAEIFASALHLPATALRERRGLGPDDGPEALAREIAETRENLVIVGHLPYLGRLASCLLVGDADRLRVHLPDASVLALGRLGDDFHLVTLLGPEELGP